MQANATLAMIPKARGMYAKRISAAEYAELLRRRTVPELAALLKRHPYFGSSLATLSTIDPHRGQIEELLNMDIFQKYQALLRYDFSEDAFAGYYLLECELREVLRFLQLLSIGMPGAYLSQLPSYLVGKTHVDLFELGQATTFADAIKATARAPYHSVLRARLLADPQLADFPMAEAGLLRFFYADVFEKIGKALAGREAETVRNLFLQQAEVYNLELLLRVKTYFPTTYAPAQLWRLLLPYRYHLKKNSLAAMVNAETADKLLEIYRRTSAVKYTGSGTPQDLAAEGGKRIYHYARRVLHLTGSPAAALAAFVSLAALEKENVVNVVEGVRYGLAPEDIRTMLRS